MDERLLAAACFQHPDRLPVRVRVDPIALAEHGRERLVAMLAEHRLLAEGLSCPAPDARPAPWRTAGIRHVDSWGVPWETSRDWQTGAPVAHPGADVPDPDPAREMGWGPIDWVREDRRLADARADGRLAVGGLRHGYLLLTLTYLLGYEPAVIGLVEEEPRTLALLERIEAFAAAQVGRWLECGATWLDYPEDLGMQHGPMIGPALFRRWIAPAYRRLMEPARAAGGVVRVHADGDLRLLADDLLTLPIDVLNLQDRVNGIDWMQERLKGRLCIDLDLDRQILPVSGSRAEIDAHIAGIIDRLWDPAGGLIISWSIEGGCDRTRLAAMAEALEAGIRRTVDRLAPSRYAPSAPRQPAAAHPGPAIPPQASR